LSDPSVDGLTAAPSWKANTFLEDVHLRSLHLVNYTGYMYIYIWGDLGRILTR